MSNVSQYHNVNLFTAGKSQPLTGQRLAKIGYKPRDGKSAKLPSVCVSIPPIQFDITNPVFGEVFKAIVQEKLESAQDSIIRSLYESSAGQLSTISDSEISLNACIAYLSAEQSGGRLTKDTLDVWFDSNIRDNLMVVIAEKLKFTEITHDNETVILKHVNVYRDLITSLASPRTILQPIQLTSLRKVLELSATDDDITKKLTTRIDSMLNKPKIEELLEL